MTLHLDPFPTTYDEFVARLGDERTCREYIAGLRWREGFKCTSHGCPGRKARLLRTRGLRVCTECRRQVSWTSGTDLHHLRIPAKTVLTTLYLMLNTAGGSSAAELCRKTGTRNYRTMARLLLLIRYAMGRDLEPIRGADQAVEIPCQYLVERRVEESSRRRRPAWHSAVVVLVAASDSGQVRARARAVPAPRHSMNSSRQDVNESAKQEGAEDPVDLRSVRLDLLFWLRRRLRGVTFDQLPRYLDEFAFRESHVRDPDRGFNRVLLRLLELSVLRS